MAIILPLDQTLPTILEDEYFSFSFDYELASNEEFDSISIESNLPEYISIDGSNISGRFTDLFELPVGSLKFVQGTTFGEVSRFADLPPKGTAQLYSYTAPNYMRKEYTIKIVLYYHDISSPGNTLNITKYYIQPIQGNWDIFKRQFINYVR